MHADAARSAPVSQLALFIGALLAFVVGSFLLFGSQAEQLAVEVLSRPLAAAVVFLLVVAGLALDVFLPLPSTIIAATGAIALGDAGGFAAVWLGLGAGCVVGYEFGATAGHAALSRLVKDSHRRRVEWLEGRLGLLGLALCRPVPVLAEVSVLLAGSARIPRSGFYAMCLAANAFVAGLYVLVLPSLGD